MFRKTIDFILSFFFKSAIRGWTIILVLCLASTSAFLITRVVKSTKFDNNYTYNIQKTYNPEISINEQLGYINQSINYLESHNLTKGHTSILGLTDDEDLQRNYNELIKFRDNLVKIKDSPEASALHAEYLKNTNKMLWRGVKDVEGISVYPHNTLYAVWGIGSIFLTIIAIFMVSTVYSDRDSRY